MDKKFSFEGLKAYEQARILVNNIYQLQNKLPKEERYALGDQIRRAAVSITANIAEGSGRVSLKEKIHFIEISFGSMTEAFCELQMATDLGYLSVESLDSLRPQFQTVAQLLSGLRNSFLDKITNH
jgi:four helix bundle protein